MRATLLLLLGLVLAMPASAQIRRNPTGVNVNAAGATTVFITFGNLEGYVPIEALWCGELVPASPALGDKCDPGTVFGALPVRFDQSRLSGTDGFSDIMSIPPSVARRAYQAAEGGADSRFFYVRRFVDPAGIRPDQYVAVTCRLTDGGARTPLALLDVQLRFAGDDPVLSVPAGAAPPPLEARIAYNGTGRLVGRWEVVLPGEEPPSAEDLLTEATLPAELRGTQKRYTEIERFNVFLPPTGEVVLPGPSPDDSPWTVNGLYQILLRIEASDDKEGDVDLEAAGAGDGILPTGAVAGFPLPVLRYFVGGAGAVGVGGHPAAPSRARARRRRARRRAPRLQLEPDGVRRALPAPGARRRRRGGPLRRAPGGRGVVRGTPLPRHRPRGRDTGVARPLPGRRRGRGGADAVAAVAGGRLSDPVVHSSNPSRRTGRWRTHEDPDIGMVALLTACRASRPLPWRPSAAPISMRWCATCSRRERTRARQRVRCSRRIARPRRPPSASWSATGIGPPTWRAPPWRSCAWTAPRRRGRSGARG